MKHFSLRLSVLLIAVITLSVLAFYLFSQGLLPQGILTVILDVVAVIMLIALVVRLSSLITIFLKGLRARDTTLRFDFGKRDSLLRDLADDMNAIAAIYHENNSQLETSKLYYDRILKIMTHEMRNYVAPVISITSDVVSHPDRYSSPESLRDVISLIHSQGDGIRRFLDSYYRLTHLPRLRLESVTAAAFASRLLPLVSADIQARGLPPSVLSFEVPQDMTMTFDVSLMTQVMLNLIRNALDAVTSVSDPSVVVKFTTSDSCPFITVTDNGIGIPQSSLDNLFQPFFTSKQDGCGVGLTLSRQIVRRHYGDLTLLHAARPTTFAISLPSLLHI